MLSSTRFRPLSVGAFLHAFIVCAAIPSAWSEDLRVKPFARDTVLVQDGAVLTTIVAATGDAALNEAARTVATAIATDVPILDESRVLDLSMDIRQDLRQRHLVLVGNAHDNRAVLRLHDLEMAKADSTYPGRNGWIVRVLVDPWGTGRNIVIVAGSDNAGTAMAAQQFAAAVEDRDRARSLPWAWRFQSGTDKSEQPLHRRRKFSEAEWTKFHRSVVFADQPIAFYPSLALSAAIKAGRAYAASGGREEVQRFRTALGELRKLGDRIEPMRKLEFLLKDLVTAWEHLEADPDISETEREEIARYLFFVGTLFESKYWNNEAPTQTKNLCATTNHISNGNLGYLKLGLYLRRRCSLGTDASARVDTWVANADLLFDAQDDSYRSACDANGYQWWTNKHMLMYALWRPDMDLFWNGNMRLLADSVFATADNLGNAAKFGDVGAGLTGFSSHAHYLLTHGTRFYRDGRQHWISRFLNRRSTDFRLRTAPLDPVDLLGVHRVPLSRAIHQHQTDVNKRPGWCTVPWSQGFDKISFRAAATPESPYLLLDGLGGMGHGHDDCNAITRVTARGRIWLIDAAYDLKTMYDHNGVFVARDGQADAPADLARISALADLPSFGATQTESPANGLRWTRHILWDKSGYFLVVDGMACRTPGDYQANCVWRSPVPGNLRGSHFITRQRGATFVIASDGVGRQKAAWEGVQRALGERAFVLRQVVSRRMVKDDAFTYANLLCWSDSGETSPTLVRIGSQAWRVDGLGDATILAVGGSVPGVGETDAAMLRVATDSLSLVGATQCSLAGRELMRASTPVNLELHADGTGLVIAGSGTQLETPLAGRLSVDGRPRAVGTRIELGSGQTRLRHDDAVALRDALAKVLHHAANMPHHIPPTDAAAGDPPAAPVR